MGEPFISEIRMMGFNYAPRHWAKCDGQLLEINQNQVLFSLLGDTFGGDGCTTFGLPDMRGRVPVHRSQNGQYQRGQMGGMEAVPLQAAELPQHTHPLNALTAPGTKTAPGTGANQLFAAANTGNFYTVPSNLTPLNSGTVTSVGGGQRHNNIQPIQVINFCISLAGAYPSRT